MPRMDQQPAVKQSEWLHDIKTQMISLRRAEQMIKNSRTELVRLKAVAATESATDDDLGTYDFFKGKAKAFLLVEVNKL